MWYFGNSFFFIFLQPALVILEQVKRWAPVPIHTISFNCDDHEANSLLHELSHLTGGRFIGCLTDDSALQGPYEVYWAGPSVKYNSHSILKLWFEVAISLKLV